MSASAAKRSPAQLAAAAVRRAKTAIKYKRLARNAWWMKQRGYKQVDIARYLRISPTLVKTVMELYPPR